MEAYLVEAIVQTLTEFPEIETVQILVNGESIESIGGHILIKEPLRRKD
jgi:spore germination protein GerM